MKTIDDRVAEIATQLYDAKGYEHFTAILRSALSEVARDQRETCAEALRASADSNSSAARMEAAAEIVMNARLGDDS